MKLKEVIEFVDELKPNAFTNKQKTAWINDLEGRIQAEVLLLTDFTKYTWEDNQDTDLFVTFPYERIYDYYLQAMIDFHNGEYDKYQNSKAAFDEMYNAFKKWYIELYHPADRPCRGEGLCSQV